ncbi:hypothetical protein GY45DRAFT_751624 [Cubamyces sp. BRFM 1775]|nr:hypothetical protein GY45DRAFT_751624 [Cubamyces sp. BRFM 1775]
MSCHEFLLCPIRPHEQRVFWRRTAMYRFRRFLSCDKQEKHPSWRFSHSHGRIRMSSRYPIVCYRYTPHTRGIAKAQMATHQRRICRGPPLPRTTRILRTGLSLLTSYSTFLSLSSLGQNACLYLSLCITIFLHHSLRHGYFFLYVLTQDLQEAQSYFAARVEEGLITGSYADDFRARLNELQTETDKLQRLMKSVWPFSYRDFWYMFRGVTKQCYKLRDDVESVRNNIWVRKRNTLCTVLLLTTRKCCRDIAPRRKSVLICIRWCRPVSDLGARVTTSPMRLRPPPQRSPPSPPLLHRRPHAQLRFRPRTSPPTEGSTRR